MSMTEKSGDCEIAGPAGSRFYVPSGFGRRFWDSAHYAQAVRIGDRIETSGQGGWNDAFEFPDTLDAEIARACSNLQRTLEQAGANWTDVVHVNSYHVVRDAEPMQPALDLLSRQFALRMGDRAPIWTAIGVVALGDPRMRIEIRVTALVSS